MIVAVAGANGKLGQLVIESLLKQSNTVKVRALVRKASPTSALSTQYPGRYEESIVDYSNKDDIQKATSGVYTVVSTLQGLEDVIQTAQLSLLDASVKNKVRRFIPSGSFQCCAF